MDASRESVIVVGGGVFGVTAALELAGRGHGVTLLDPGPLPHPDAASTDISKMVRMDYGPDEFYMALGEEAMDGWDRWSRAWPRPLFHADGFLLLSPGPMEPGGFERESWDLLRRRGHRPMRLDRGILSERFAPWTGSGYGDGYYNARAGWAESGEVIRWLVGQARKAGVHVRSGVRVANHGRGVRVDPDGPRPLPPHTEASFRRFLRSALPEVADRPVVGRRLCLYCDTFDGDLWVGADPDREGLVVAAGGSGHGFEFAPVLGPLIADAVESRDHPSAHRFRWRAPGPRRTEAARSESGLQPPADSPSGERPFTSS